MKIFVSIASNKTKTNDLKEGVDALKRIGHNVNISDRFSDKNDKLIKDCDLLIAEISELNYKQGFEIARALDEKKVVIALEEEGSNNSKDLPKNKSLIVKRYSSKDLVPVIEKAIKEAESKLDSKFILIISPEIDRYLEWAAQAKRMHKAQIVRNAVEQQMKKDKDYKEYLD